MNINKVKSFSTWLLVGFLTMVAALGAFYPICYILVLLLLIGILLFHMEIKQILNVLFWLIVVALFLGAYLSVPGYASVYLFRILLPLHLLLVCLTREFKWVILKQYKIYLILLGLYFISSVASLWLADSLSLGFRYCYFIFEICYLFFLCFYHLDSKAKMHHLFQVISVIFAISLVIGMVEILTGWHLPLSGSNVYITTTSKFQPTGFLFNTNDYALFMAILYPIVASFILQFKKRYLGEALYYVTTFLTLYVIISTYSRIGFITVIISVLVVFFYQFKEKAIILLFGGLPFIFLLVWFSPFASKLVNIVYTAFTDKGTSTAARENLYNLLYKIIKDSHFLGVGAGNVPKKLNSLLIGYTNTSETAYTTGHNFWLETIGNIGLIGFLVCISLFIYYLIQIFLSNYLKNSPVALLIWITFIGASIALSTILEKRFLWFILAIGICLIHSSSREDEKFEST